MKQGTGRQMSELPTDWREAYMECWRLPGSAELNAVNRDRNLLSNGHDHIKTQLARWPLLCNPATHTGGNKYQARQGTALY